MTAKGVLGRALGAAASTSEIYTGWVGASCEFTHPLMRLPLLDMRRSHESPAAFAEELRIVCYRFGFFHSSAIHSRAIALASFSCVTGFLTTWRSVR